MGKRNSLTDVSFIHTNDAFKKRQHGDPGQSTLLSFSRRAGIDGSNFLHALNGMRAGESKSLSIENAERTTWFECDVTRSGTGNFLILAHGDGRGQEPCERVIVPYCAGQELVILPPEDNMYPARPSSEDGKPLRDRKGEPIDRKLFNPFLEAHAEIPNLDELIDMLCQYGTLESYAKNSHFLETGAFQTAAGFILKGLFRKYRISQDGLDYTMSFYRTGTIIGSGSDFRLQNRSAATIEARTDCLVFCVDMKILARLAHEDHRWYRLFYYTMSDKHTLQNEQNYSLRCENAETRYKRFLSNYRDVIPFVRSYHIASFLGITPETLSRVRKTLSESESPSQ